MAHDGSDTTARIYRALGVTEEEQAEFEAFLEESGYNAARTAAEADESTLRDHLRAVGVATASRLTRELGVDVVYDDSPAPTDPSV